MKLTGEPQGNLAAAGVLPTAARSSPRPGSRLPSCESEVEELVTKLGREPTECLLCGSPAPRVAFERCGKRYWRCSACTLVFVHDIYPEFAARTNLTYVHEARRGPKPRELKDWSALLREMERSRRTGRLLEVGCGSGRFLAEARSAGWRVSGVELLLDLASVAKGERGLDVHESELGQVAFDACSFDVVYMNEVIEHVVDPVDLLAEVHRILRPGGIAFVRTGNALGWSARLRGAGWWYYEFGGGGHIRFWSPASFRALARATGFSEARISTRGFAFREGRELAGRWFGPLVRLAGAPVSAFAGRVGSGQRLTARLVKAEARGTS